MPKAYHSVIMYHTELLVVADRPQGGSEKNKSFSHTGVISIVQPICCISIIQSNVL
jgi:hypothetical protein